MNENLTVFIVDDDPSVRDALSLMLGVHNYRVAVFGDAESFLGAHKFGWQGCVLLDIRTPGMDGLNLQKHLGEISPQLPVIVMTAHGDVSSARQAFRALAVDFLEKPLDQKRLLSAVEEAFSVQREKSAKEMNRDYADRLIESLTPRESQVMGMVVAGRHNREIAAELNISPRTVEVHKARVMDKLGVRNVADLVRMSMQLEA
jgi:RNA polymerase sigma factor (sigma-70 family)